MYPSKKTNYFTSSDPHHDMLGGGCQVRVVRVSTPCYLPPHKSFLLFRTSHLLPPTHQENTWQTNVKTAATAHAQTCQNMSGYDLSNIYKETEIKHVSRPPEARSKVIATATAHAQTCQNMSGYDLSNIYEETEIKHVSRPPEARSKVFATATAHAQITNALQCVTRSILCTKHAKSCQDTTCQHISRINTRHQTCQ